MLTFTGHVYYKIALYKEIWICYMYVHAVLKLNRKYKCNESCTNDGHFNIHVTPHLIEWQQKNTSRLVQVQSVEYMYITYAGEQHA